MGRYAPLTVYLKNQPADLVRVSFADIEGIIERKLPESASTHRAWWSNNPSNNVMTRAWLAAGFQSEQVDLPGRTLVFRRKSEGGSMSGLQEPHVPFEPEQEAMPEKFALFGWQKGTVTIAPGVDLAEPADPDMADLIDELYGPPA